MKSELEKLMSGYEYPVSVIFEKKRTRNKKFNKNQFTLLEWCVVMHLNYNGEEFYHSYQSIADDTDISRGTVQTALKELKEKGYISIRNLNMGKTNNECTNIRLHPASIVRDLPLIYDTEVCKFGCKTKMYTSIEKYYTRLAEVTKEEKTDSIEKKKDVIWDKNEDELKADRKQQLHEMIDSIEKKEVDWDKIEKELKEIREQQIHEMIASIEDLETELPECPEVDYIELSLEQIEKYISYFQEIELHEISKKEAEAYFQAYTWFKTKCISLNENEFCKGVLTNNAFYWVFAKLTSIEELKAITSTYEKESQSDMEFNKSETYRSLSRWFISMKEVVGLTDRFQLHKSNPTSDFSISEKQINYIQGLLEKRQVTKQQQQYFIQQLQSIRVNKNQVSGIIDELKAVA